jgi:hypothetical protein
METEGNREIDVTTRIPALLCNDHECRITVDEGNTDDETALHEDVSLSHRNGAADADADADAVLDAEVVKERDLHQEVQERMNRMTVDALLVVNLSSNKEENNNAQANLRRNSTAILQIAAAALIILAIVCGTVVGTRNLPQKPLSTITTASPSTSISVWEFARNILTPLSGGEALMDKSSPQYKALSWIVRDDPANMMMQMMGSNETQSTSSSTLTIVMERYVMALLYFSTDGPNWVSPYDFLSMESICDWGEPIRCNEEGAAVRIRIAKCVLL